MSAHKHLARLDRLHKAPSRPEPISLFGSIKIKQERFQRSNPQWSRKGSEEQRGQREETEDENWEPEPVSPQSAEKEEKPVNKTTVGIKPLENKSMRGEDGVLVTDVGGWEVAPFEPIMMMNLNEIKEKHHPRQVLERYAMYFVRLVNVVSPNNFFMEFIIEPPNDGCKTWYESLQKFYGDPETQEKYKMRTLKPFVGQLYAAQVKGKWERLRVQYVDYTNQTVSGLFMDQLKKAQAISFDWLFELHPKYGNWHAYPINGGLRDVKPINLDPNNATWSDEANDYFKNFVKDKLFRIFVVSKGFDTTDTAWHVQNEDRFTKLSVLLFEVGPDVPQISVNGWLVQKGYAKEHESLYVLCSSTQLMKDLHGLNLELEQPKMATDIEMVGNGLQGN